MDIYKFLKSHEYFLNRYPTSNEWENLFITN